MAALTSSHVAMNHMTLSRGSAGMFIPRGSIDNLRSLNHEVEKKGSLEMHSAPPQFAVQTQRRMGFQGESGFHGMEGRGGEAGRSGMSAPPSASSSAGHVSAPSGGGGRH
jgi:hypothetical protein